MYDNISVVWRRMNWQLLYELPDGLELENWPNKCCWKGKRRRGTSDQPHIMPAEEKMSDNGERSVGKYRRYMRKSRCEAHCSNSSLLRQVKSICANGQCPIVTKTGEDTQWSTKRQTHVHTHIISQVCRSRVCVRSEWLYISTRKQLRPVKVLAGHRRICDKIHRCKERQKAYSSPG